MFKCKCEWTFSASVLALLLVAISPASQADCGLASCSILCCVQYYNNVDTPGLHEETCNNSAKTCTQGQCQSNKCEMVMTTRLKYSISGSVTWSAFGLTASAETEHCTGTTCLTESSCKDTGTASANHGGYVYTLTERIAHYWCYACIGHDVTAGTLKTTTGCYT